MKERKHRYVAVAKNARDNLEPRSAISRFRATGGMLQGGGTI